jgi:hypothetical protein
VLGQRRGRRHADQIVAVERAADKGARRGGISLEIAALVIHVAVIEIGKGAKDRDAQPRQIVEARGDLLARQRTDSTSSLPSTCAVQS